MNLYARHLNRVLSAVIFFLVASCNWEYVDTSRSHSVHTAVPVVTATTGMIADIVRAIVRDEMTVVQLVSHGVDPHLYRPGRDDIVKLLKADLVVYNGLYLEGKMQEALGAGKVSKKATAISSLLPESNFLSEEDTMFDPHLWMDVRLWHKVIMPLAELLTTLDPLKKEMFYKNARELEKQYLELHQYGVALVESLPEERRVLVTSHDAFQYFGKAYGMNVYGVQGFSTDSEAGVRRINEIISVIINQNIPVVFFESGVSPRLLQSIIEAVEARGRRLGNGGILYTDSLGPAASPTGTYLGMMKHNFETIYTALKNE